MERIVGDRRCKLVNRRLTLEARDGEVAVERVIADAAELDEALRTYFGMEPPAPAEALFARIGA
jgi:N-hydroxyarylamine O-acetyltransferase